MGATWGCGILEGKSGINWKSSALIFGGWLTTCVIAGTFTGIIFSLGAYAPSVQEGREIERYEDGLKALMLSMAKDMKAAAASKPGVVATLDAKYLSSDKTSAMPVNSWYKGKYTKSDGKSSDWKTPYGGKYIFKATQSATETMQYMNDLVQLMKENDITI